MSRQKRQGRQDAATGGTPAVLNVAQTLLSAQREWRWQECLPCISAPPEFLPVLSVVNFYRKILVLFRFWRRSFRDIIGEAVLQKVFLIFGLLMGAFFASAQNAAQMGFSELVSAADYALQNKDPETAVPLLKEIIVRAGGLEDRAAKESIQQARIQLGQALCDTGEWEDAEKYISDYLANEPVKDRVAAQQIQCRIAQASGNWEGLQTMASAMVNDKTISLRHKETAEQFLLQACFHLGKYEEALAMIPDAIKRTKDAGNVRAYRLMQIRCLFETGQTTEVIKALPVLFRGDSRDDVTLNLTLLNIADRLFEQQKYREALAIYRLVLSKGDLLNRQQENLSKLEANTRDKDREWKITQLREALESLQKVPGYDVHIAYRAAQIYSEQKRYWESVILFDQLFQKYPSREEGLSAFFQKILLLYELKQYDEAIAISEDYLEKNKSGLYARLICTRLMQHYLNDKNYEPALALLRYIDRWNPPADEDERGQDLAIRYLVSFVYFQMMDYDKAIDAFEKVAKIGTNTAEGMDARYWQGMCRLLQQNFPAAYDIFMNYRKEYSRAAFAPDALFRAGVCRFGMEEYDSAKALFKEFIETYPEDELMPDALAMYADLLGADGLLDEAVALYRQAVDFSEKRYADADDMFKKQFSMSATYAVFQMAVTLELDAEAYKESKDLEKASAKYSQLISQLEDYVKIFGDDADWAQAVFWIGKAQLAQGEAGKTVDAYLDAVIRYGNDPAQTGVASILSDLANIIRMKLTGEQRAAAEETIRNALAGAEGKPALKIRLEVLTAELNGTQDELSRTLLAREKELSVVPPAGLSLMCAALLEAQDYSRAEEFFNLFSENYENSPFMKNAYKLRAEDLYRRQNYDEAMVLAESALGLYGADPAVGWSALMKGNIEVLRGDYAEAEKTFQLIFNVRAWRGPVAAEAMYRTGESWFLRGNYEKAFAFYQRTYLLYKAYAGGRWAADAYVKSAECLDKMGRPAAARNTFRAMLLDDYVRELPQSNIARERLGPQETAELLAGRTNTMEAVEAEVSQ